MNTWKKMTFLLFHFLRQEKAGKENRKKLNLKRCGDDSTGPMKRTHSNGSRKKGIRDYNQNYEEISLEFIKKS